jgi:hypothetical protein
VLDEVVTGSGAVAGDHELAAEPGRDRGDRRVHDRGVVRGGIGPGRAAALFQASGSPPVLSQTASSG